ncbi:hypothetical protein FGADI_2624 [Fusarium gaditjirri]|uniref:Uncharacterized protein n=1 Tax=Fusarium gaditjirri TaxID=282569 RepID=A0A8H4X187_9HYPO|nr:hypothetical protein FGADI_2624 [Fusarium gaditjirri]
MSPEKLKRLQDQEAEYQAWRRGGGSGTDGSWNAFVALKNQDSSRSMARGHVKTGGGSGEEKVKNEK